MQQASNVAAAMGEGSIAYVHRPMNTQRVAVDPNSPKTFEWRHGSRHEFGSVGAINALAAAQAKRDRKQAKRRQIIQRAAQDYGRRASFNPITFVCPPPKPSNQGSAIVLKFAPLHAERARAFKHQSDLDWAFAEQTRQRRMLQGRTSREDVAYHARGHQHVLSDDAQHVHSDECGCGHDHHHPVTAAPVFVEKPAVAEAPATPAVEDRGFYAFGSDSSGRRLGPPVVVTHAGYRHKEPEPVAPPAPPAHELIVKDGTAPAAKDTGKRLADEAWLVTWMLANGRGEVLKSTEALKKMKSDTHSLRRGQGVKKDAIPSDSVRAIMAEHGL
jgi:hypothetical protein